MNDSSGHRDRRWSGGWSKHGHGFLRAGNAQPRVVRRHKKKIDKLDLSHQVVDSLVLTDCQINELNCEGTVFLAELQLVGCMLHETVFRGALLPDNARMTGCSFGSAVPPSNDLGSTTFAAGTSRANGGAIENNTLRHLRFECCKFDGYTTFNNRRFTRSPTWYRCTFGRPPAFLGAEMHPGARFDDCTFQVPDLTGFGAVRDSSQIGSDSIRAFRALRKSALNSGDLKLANDFNVLEMKTRRKTPNATRTERVLLSLYGLVSEYGSSISRPIAVLAAGLAMLALIVCVVSHFTLGLSDWPVSGSIRLVVGQALIPFSAFQFDYVTPRELSGWASSGPEWAMLVPSASASILTLSALALFLFAVRRRFVG